MCSPGANADPGAQTHTGGRAKAEVGGALKAKGSQDAKRPPEGRGAWVRLPQPSEGTSPTLAPSSHSSQSWATGVYRLSHATLGRVLYHNSHEKSMHGLERLQPLSEFTPNCPRVPFGL